MREMADLDGKHSALGGEDFGGFEVFLKLRAIEGCGHDDDFQVRPDCILEIQRPCERDVAVEVPLVEFIEDQSRNAPQVRVGQHLTKKNALGDEENFRFLRGNIVEADLVAHLAAQSHRALGGHAGSQHASSQAAGLEDDAAPATKNPAIEQNLGNLGGFSRAGRSLQNETVPAREGGYDFLIEVVDGQCLRHPELRLRGFEQL